MPRFPWVKDGDGHLHHPDHHRAEEHAALLQQLTSLQSEDFIGIQSGELRLPNETQLLELVHQLLNPDFLLNYLDVMTELPTADLQQVLAARQLHCGILLRNHLGGEEDLQASTLLYYMDMIQWNLDRVDAQQTAGRPLSEADLNLLEKIANENSSVVTSAAKNRAGRIWAAESRKPTRSRWGLKRRS